MISKSQDKNQLFGPGRPEGDSTCEAQVWICLKTTMTTFVPIFFDEPGAQTFGRQYDNLLFDSMLEKLCSNWLEMR